MLLNLVAWIVFGALAGWLASIIMRTNAEMGVFANIIVGIIGAIIGGYLVRLLGGDGISGFNIKSLLVAVAGAVLLLALLRAFRRTV